MRPRFEGNAHQGTATDGVRRSDDSEGEDDSPARDDSPPGGQRPRSSVRSIGRGSALFGEYFIKMEACK